MRSAPEHISPPTLRSIQLHSIPPEKFACTLITPLYGGGVEAGKIDISMPIRATSIRGQLRFWWRITNRKRFSGAEKDQNMFAAEREIWGGLGKDDDLSASKVDIRVTDIHIHQAPAAAARYDRKKDNNQYETSPHWESWAGGTKAGGYVLFPAQGKALKTAIQTEPSKLLKPGSVSWSLEIRFSDDCPAESREQVLTALRWWASFGGIGGRTRRGLGAVRVENLAPVSKEEVKEHGCTLVLQEPAPQEKAHESAVEAWRAAIKALREFRQEAGIGRNKGSGPNRPGRSRWPEADAIRRITHKNSREHQPTHPAGNIFPRAAFGLPIIFQFKKDERSRDDPEQHSLQPENAERLASPIILRPYWDGSKWRPAALYLGKETTKLILRGPRGDNPVKEWPEDGEQRKTAIQEIHPIQMVAKKHPGKIASPLAAFLNYFKKPTDYSEG